MYQQLAQPPAQSQQLRAEGEQLQQRGTGYAAHIDTTHQRAGAGRLLTEPLALRHTSGQRILAAGTARLGAQASLSASQSGSAHAPRN